MRVVNTQILKKSLLVVASILLVGGLSGCATTAQNPKDPYEGFNRAMFSLNEGIDTVVKPIAQGYDIVTPSPIKAGIGNFFGNIGELWVAINHILQGKGEYAASDVARFVVNSTVGIAGIFDIATEMDIEKRSADFGETLGKWGVAEGPFFYWPIIGPRTARDTLGWGVDAFADPVIYVKDIPVRNTMLGVRAIDMRASMLPADKIIEQAAFDKYNYIRDAYLQNRRSKILDGKRPPDDEDGEN